MIDFYQNKGKYSRGSMLFSKYNQTTDFISSPGNELRLFM